MDSYVGQIMLFPSTREIENWLPCDGRQLPISGNEALYALIGLTYGGDGRTNFAIPDLRGRVPVCQGHGISLTDRIIGQTGGAEAVTLTAANMPAHTHSLNASTNQATSNDPTNNVLASVPTNHTSYFDPPNPLPAGVTIVPMGISSLTSAGVAQSHNNIMPSLVLNYYICTVGIYPTKP